jgi:hypothetical protein
VLPQKTGSTREEVREMSDQKGAIELRPVSKPYPSVVLTQGELNNLLDLIKAEFRWNDEVDTDYPYLDTARAKLELFED